MAKGFNHKAGCSCVVCNPMRRRRNPGAAWHLQEYNSPQTNKWAENDPYWKGYKDSHYTSSIMSDLVKIPNPTRTSARTRTKLNPLLLLGVAGLGLWWLSKRR